MQIKRISIVLLGLFALPALAAEPAPYVGIGGGMYNVKIDTGGFSSDFDDSAGLFRVFGGYQFNEYIALQADFMGLADAEDNFGGSNVKLSSGKVWEAAARASYPFNEQFNVFARLGWAWYEFNIKASGFGGGSSNDDDFFWGGGGTWQFTPQLGLQGEYSVVDVSGGDFDMWSFSLVYTFK